MYFTAFNGSCTLLESFIILSEVSKFMSIQKTSALHSPVDAVNINSYSIEKFYILSSKKNRRLFPYTSPTVWLL